VLIFLKEVLVNARVGNNMVERRSGYAYYQYENELMKKFLKDKFISSFEYGIVLSIKLVLRILPVKILSVFYQKFLREANN